MKYSQRLLESVISDLRNRYNCLWDDSFIRSIPESISMPDTGNDTWDYETLLDRMVTLCDKAEPGYS